MMKHCLHLSLLILSFLLMSLPEAFSQTVTVEGILRPRFEIQYGYKYPPDTIVEPQILTSQRSRLNLGFANDRFSAFISLQDVRIWGDEVIASDVPSFGLHEGWGQYNFSKSIALRVGRQELMYDNKRLLTDGFWIQQGRAWDAAALKLDFGRGWRSEIVGSFNQQTNVAFFNTFYNLANPKTLDVFWINKAKTDSTYKYTLSGIIVGDGYQTPDTTGVFMRWTYGANWFYDHQRWGINLEAYGQSGKTRTINQSGFVIPDSFQTVKAYSFTVNPWVAPVKNLQIGVGVDFLSGSDALDTAITRPTHMFNPQYGATDRYYGRIDLFFNLPADTRNGGLIDGYLNMKYDLKKWIINAEVHSYYLENNVEDVENPGTALSKGLGTEVDVWVVKDITKEVNLNTGAAIFLPTRSMEFVKTTTFSQVGSPTVNGYWFYCMLTFKPTFYKSKPAEPVK